jgi:hypothetical protein
MKYLVVSGCSHSNGTGIEYAYNKKIDSTPESVRYQRENRWSRLLSDKLNLEEIHLGRDAASNWQIYHNVMNWILENPDKINDSLFIISWSYSDRNYLGLTGDFYQGQKLLFSSKRPGQVGEFIIDYIPSEVTKLKMDGVGPGEVNLEDDWDEVIQKNSLLYMIGLTSILGNQNLKYLHFHSDFHSWIDPDSVTAKGLVSVPQFFKGMKLFINFFDEKNYIFDETYRNYCIDDILRPPKYDFHDGHIGPDGQKSWADYLYQQLLGRGII